MSSVIPAVTPRRDGEPEVDLTAVRLVHRAMLTDVRALADLADRVAGGTTTLGADRRAALRRYADRLCIEIGTVHDGEGGELWPVVAASAGSAVDLSDLADDHHAIDPVLARCRTAVAALNVDADDREAAALLAGGMTDLLGLLVEHVAEEERELFPAVAAFVSVADYEASLARMRRRAGVRRLAWLLPWVAQHATAAEVQRSLAAAGRGTRLLLTVSTPRFARQRRAALG